MLGEIFLRKNKYKHAQQMKSVTENVTMGLRPDSTDTYSHGYFFVLVSRLRAVIIQNKIEQVLNKGPCLHTSHEVTNNFPTNYIYLHNFHSPYLMCIPLRALRKKM